MGLRCASAAVVAFALAIVVSGCTTTSTTTTDPSPVKCQVSLASSLSSVDSSGGSGSVTVTTAAECAWNASADVGWISFDPPPSGQGSGKVDFHVAPNTDPSSRRGTITVNGQRVTIDQTAATQCTLTLGSSGQTVAATGGTGTVSVVTGSACAWTAVSNADWITITSGATGTGNGSVGFAVAATTGEARTGTIAIGGQTFTVTQTAPPPANCTFVVTPTSQSVGSAGGTGSATVSVASTCPWTAASNVPWVTVTSGATGTGNGSVSFNVAPNSGVQRTGTLTIAGQTFTVTQAAPTQTNCPYAVSPMTQGPLPSGGGNGNPVTVQTPLECTWTATASSDAPWITNVRGGGSGPGQVTFSVTANSGPARTGHLIIAGQSVTVTQADGCTFMLNPPSNTSVPIGGGNFSFVVTPSSSSCGWSASVDSGSASWLHITSVAGTTVNYHVDPSTGPRRMGSIRVAGVTSTATFNVTQLDGCTFTFAPVSPNNVPKTAGSYVVAVSASNSLCTWNVRVSTDFSGGGLSITAPPGGNGTGSNPFTFSVTANLGAARTGILTFTGPTFTATYTIIQALGP